MFEINIENLKTLKHHIFFKKLLFKIFREESIEILKILGLVTNTEEYQKIYNHV